MILRPLGFFVKQIFLAFSEFPEISESYGYISASFEELFPIIPSGSRRIP